MASSTLTTLQLIDYCRSFSMTAGVLGVAGYSQQPALSFANDVMQQIMAKPNAWKWNSQPVPPININPYQQDYPTSISQNTMGWLESCTQIDINNLTQEPPTQLYVQAVDRLQPTFICGIATKICWVANAVAQTGTWPGPSILYQNPLVSQGGGPNNNNKISITDTNGNIQNVTTYGTTGTIAPSTSFTLSAAGNASGGTTTYTGVFPTPLTVNFPAAIAGFNNGVNNGTFTVVSCSGTSLRVNNPAGVSESRAATAVFNPWPISGAAPGTTTTDGTVVWTLVDPNGVCFRIDRQATTNSQVWQLNAIYQVKPTPLTSLNQTWAPIPDDLSYLVKQGFLTYCYKAGDAKQRALFKEEYQQWLVDITEAMGASDREDQEYGFAPTQPVQGGVGSGGGVGGWGYPGWPGWTGS